MAGERPDDPLHFADRTDFRAWLRAHHDSVDELWIGLWKKATGKGGITYPGARDECLCWGWIDGVRKRVDDERYTVRLTPRLPRSRWSRVNVERYEELDAAGEVAEPGRAARARFEATPEEPYDLRDVPGELPEPYATRLREHAAAWAFHRDQPPGYRRNAVFWITSAKREDTRTRRLEKLIRFAEAGERLPELGGGTGRREP